MHVPKHHKHMQLLSRNYISNVLLFFIFVELTDTLAGIGKANGHIFPSPVTGTCLNTSQNSHLGGSLWQPQRTMIALNHLSQPVRGENQKFGNNLS